MVWVGGSVCVCKTEKDRDRDREIKRLFSMEFIWYLKCLKDIVRVRV